MVPVALRERWTLAGGPEGERRVTEDLRQLAAGLAGLLGPALRAVVIVGGYARGEGGIVRQDGAVGPYNDYDLVAVVRGRRPRRAAALRRFAREWSARLNVGVDVLALSERRFANPPSTLLWLDAALGGARVVAGDAILLRGLRRVRPRRVPLSECGRLLANRAAGVALSNLEGPRPDALRLALHGHKAVLACGDVRLLAADRYAPTLAERAEELQRLSPAPGVGHELAQRYLEAVAFRARPDAWRPHAGDVSHWWEATRRLVCLWHLGFEVWRVGAPGEPLAFARWRGRLFADAPDIRPGGALLAALRAALWRRLPLLGYLGHPRERLARAAVALAYCPDEAGRTQAADLLGLPHSCSFAALSRRLRALIPLAG